MVKTFSAKLLMLNLKDKPHIYFHKGEFKFVFSMDAQRSPSYTGKMIQAQRFCASKNSESQK